MFLRSEPAVDVAGKVLDEFGDVDGLKEVIEGILALEDSEVYEKLVHMGNPIDSSVDKGYAAKSDDYSDLAIFAGKYLSKFPLNIPLAPLIDIKHFWVIYTFIGDLYSIRTNHNIYQKDLYKVENGEIATRIILLLEDFDSDIETSKPNAEFFKRLGKVKWQNKQAKRLFSSLVDLRLTLVYEKWGGGGSISTFLVTEDAFILLLAGCSAVICGRDKINSFDVIMANKTYLKLINTDITRLM